MHLHFSSNVVNYAVLGTSFLFEALSFRVALREFRHASTISPFMQAFFDARDPTVPLVLAEDTTALLGLSLALAAIFLRAATGDAFWDPLGSVLIGALLASSPSSSRGSRMVFSSARARPTKTTRASSKSQRASTDVERVTQILSVHLGPDVIVLALKIAFTPGTTVERRRRADERNGTRIRGDLPRMRKIFIEVDSHGDGRGLPAPEETK